MPRIITWDLEIKLSPTDLDGGWEAARRGDAGISCVALYDTDSGRTHVYDEYGLEECLYHLNSADILVGFNTIEFDTPVIQSVSGMDVSPIQYDILRSIWKSLQGRKKGYSLGAICERMDLGSKNSDGESAPELYSTGRFGKLFDYCMNDVHLTRQLANHIFANGYILTPEGEPLELPRLEVEA